jgi:predicted thioesterase
VNESEPPKTADPEGSKIEPGLEGMCERVVLPEWTRAHYDADFPAVFSTPAMIGLMELATSEAIRPFLPPGKFTVGIRIEVNHLKAAPIGAKILTKSKLVEIDGRRLIFEVEAWHGTRLVGNGRVFHAIVDFARFHAKAAEKP